MKRSRIIKAVPEHVLEIRRRLYAMAYSRDKSIATFLGSPASGSMQRSLTCRLRLATTAVSAKEQFCAALVAGVGRTLEGEKTSHQPR